jgi:hypothetical protein
MKQFLAQPINKYFLSIMGTDTPEGRLLVISLAAILTIIKNLFFQYVWSDPSFIVGLIILIGIDTVTGIWKSRIKKQFVSQKLGKNTATKLILYFLSIGAIKQVDKFMIGSWAEKIGHGFVDIMCLMMLCAELLSILENVSEINPNSPFAPIIRTLKRFLKSGAIEDLTPKTAADLDAEDKAKQQTPPTNE